MKRIVLTCLFIFLVLAGFAQDNRSDNLVIDSLKHQLAISKSDTNSVKALVGLISAYKYSNPDSSFFYGQQAIALASKIHYLKGEMDGLVLLALTNEALGNISKAMELCFKVLKIADKNNLVIYKKSGLSLLGRYFRLSKNYSKALSYLYQSVKISDPKRSSVYAFITMFNLANTYLDMNKLDSATYYNLLASEIINKYNLKGFQNRTSYISGMIQYKKSNIQPAISLLRQALYYDSKSGDRYFIAVIPYEIARIYQQNRQPDSAIFYAERSLEAAQEFKRYMSIVQASKLLAELYEPRDLQKAITYNKTAIAAQDTIHYFENSSAVSSLSEYDEKARQYEIETAQTAYKNKTRQYMLVAGLTVFLLIAFILYRNNKKQQKANKLLHQQKNEIEEQRTEAQIEAALERIRSRSLAMHNSGELKEVISIMLKNLQELDFKMEKRTLIIYTFEEGSKGFTQWVASPEHDNIMGLKTPYSDNQILFDLWNAREKGIDFYAKSYSIEIKNAAFKYFFEVLPEMEHLPLKEKDYLVNAEFYELSCALEKNSGVAIANFTSQILSSKEHEILKRFAKVFEQAYIRFLDLKKAEAQAREAKIEASLEKVRSQSMAMHQSNDLLDVTRVLAEQLTLLEIKFDSVTFGKIYKDGNWDLWISTPDQTYPAKIYIPYIDNNIFNDANKVREKEGNFLASSYTLEEKNIFFKHFFENTEAKIIQDTKKQEVLNRKGFARSLFLIKNIDLNISNYEGIPYTDDENEILHRFANVFEQAYIRFIDLKKAEAQAWEAKIEASLERVRSRTMAMQRSEELTESVKVLFEEFKKLTTDPNEVILGRGFITIINEHNECFDLWVTDAEGNEIKQFFKIDFAEPTTGKLIYNAWKTKQPNLVNDLEGEKLKLWLDYLSSIDFPLGSTLYAKRRVNSFIFHTKGFIGITSSIPLSQESIQTLERFAKVFDLTYTRFTDLQNAEARTLVAVREASLDRVRAEIASMRHAEDLQRITPLVWRELMVLNVPFFRCGLFIVDETSRQIHFYLSTPDGKPLVALNLTFDVIGAMQEALANWRMKKVYITHWTKEEFVSFAQSLMEQGQIDSQYSYQGGEEAPASITLHFIPFAQGMLYIGSAESLSVNQIESVQALSDAFETAYARYEDFIKLEGAKKQIENTLKDLRDTQQQLIQSEKMASLGELTAGIAHEIQNPLNFINNFSEVNGELIQEMKKEIEEGNFSDAKTIANDIEANEKKISYHGKRADSIVKGMMQHSSGGVGTKESTDLNALAEEYLRLSYHGVRARDKTFNAALDTQFDNNVGKVEVISQDIGRVLLNLFNNAFYSMIQKQKLSGEEYKPMLSVSTKKLDQGVEIRVKDNGMGIPQKVLDKIYQPFFTTKPTGEGTGLGLSLSYDIITKVHGGTLNVESKEGEGATFIIELPKVQ